MSNLHGEQITIDDPDDLPLDALSGVDALAQNDVPDDEESGPFLGEAE